MFVSNSSINYPTCEKYTTENVKRAHSVGHLKIKEFDTNKGQFEIRKYDFVPCPYMLFFIGFEMLSIFQLLDHIPPMKTHPSH